MKNVLKRSIAMTMVLTMLIILLPVSVLMTAKAEEPAADDNTPILNKTIVGTVHFQSFNFLGDNPTGSDGVDYQSTYYYTDDFFSPSAVNPNVNGTNTKATWKELTDTELSLASTSFDLTVAAYASNERNVKTATNRSWANTDYSEKDKNAKQMLEGCGFEGFESHDYFHAPTNDSIAYVIASKKIKVWDEDSGTNKDFTLVAVAVRGAGYGAEWASNITIGNKNSNQLPANGRHSGFDEAAKTVCSGIQTYLSTHNIDSDVKYWVTGYSRAGATANLVAGYLTDGAESTYHSHQKDIYGYTWECPQGAATTENAAKYKNIHNIINAMDAVPKVSPDAFNHQRLGVDYVMPYYGNTTSNENKNYYNKMRDVLQTIAVGAYNYKGESYTEDPLISVTDPSNYPYNRAMTIRTITATQLIADAVDGTLMENFGTVEATGSNKKLRSDLYIDQFIDDLIDVFLTSRAWINEIGGSRTALQNRATFISNFQSDFRNVLGYLLDYSGPAFLGMVDAMVDAIGEQLSLSNTATNAGLGLAFLNFYEYPTSTYKWGVPPFIDPWVGKPSWAGQTRRAVLISEAQPVVRNVVRNMVGNDFVDPQGISRAQFETSLDDLVQLVVNLYADELSKYNSNYFGTTLYYLWQILCTHEQEVVMSWIKSLDSNHMNRSYKTLTVPLNARVELHEFRKQHNEVASANGEAPVVAVFENGDQVSSKDQRIYTEASGSNLIIRYPASLTIRADITLPEDSPDLDFKVEDYQIKSATVDLSIGERQYETLSGNNYTNITTDASKTNAAEINSLTDDETIYPMTTYDVLHIWSNGTDTFDANNNIWHAEKETYEIENITKVIDFNSKMILATQAERPEVELSTNGSFDLDDDKNATYQLNSGKLSSKNLKLNLAYTSADTAIIKGIFDNESKTVKKRVTVVPASSIYFNDQLAEETISIGDGSGYNAALADQIGTAASQSAQNVTGTFYFTFYGTGIDVYCTTHDNGGFVSAAVFTGSGESACVKANRVGSAKTVREYSAGNYYNTPSVNFSGLTADTYTLKLVANDNAQFKLDGVRVYNPVQAGSAAETELNKTDEANAIYLNLRKVLLNDDNGKDVFTVDNNLPTGDVDPSAVSGVLFINDVSSVVTTSNWYKDEGATEATFHDEPGQIYQSQFDVYKANGPKNEIYLNNGQAVTFQLNTAKFDENTKVYIGLSAPVSGSGDVVINGEEVDPAVTTVMDMYYPIDIDLEQAENNSLSVTVKNVGSDVISVTNLKITGNAALVPASAPDNEQESLNAARALFAPVTMKTVRMAVNKGIDPEVDTAKPEDPAVTEEPEETEKPDDGSLVIDEPEETAAQTPAPSVTPDKPAETGNTIQKVVQSITKTISSFFKSIFRR